MTRVEMSVQKAIVPYSLSLVQKGVIATLAEGLYFFVFLWSILTLEFC